MDRNHPDYHKKYTDTSKVEAYVRPSIKEKVLKHAKKESISASKAVEIALDTFYREHPESIERRNSY